MGSSTYRSPRLAVSRGVTPRGRSDAPARPGRTVCCGAPSIRRRTSWAHNSPPLLRQTSTWRQIPGDLKAAKRDPIQARILTGQVRGVFDDLLGKGAWSPPRDWGRAIVTFPEPGAWEVPTRLWHWDNLCDLHIDQPRALFVVSFIGSVAPGSGGTLILSGSPRLLIQQERRIPASQRGGSGTSVWERFHRSHPWLMALTGLAPSPADRTAAFMAGETFIEDVPLRVVELTGEPGDMVFCHPVIVHCRAQNRGARPRFMRIKQQLLTNEGRKLRSQEHT
jgi:hypothetical protein